jgi:hypothetical protein
VLRWQWQTKWHWSVSMSIDEQLISRIQGSVLVVRTGLDREFHCPEPGDDDVREFGGSRVGIDREDSAQPVPSIDVRGPSSVGEVVGTAEWRESIGEIGQVVDASPRTGFVEIDQCDGCGILEDEVVRSRIPVADHLGFDVVG